MTPGSSRGSGTIDFDSDHGEDGASIVFALPPHAAAASASIHAARVMAQRVDRRAVSCVSTGVRLATFLAIAVCAAASPARADDDDDTAYAPLPSPQLGLNVVAVPVPMPAPASVAGLGPGGELGFGLGRFQLVAEAAFAYGNAQTKPVDHVGGWVGRAGGALRWIAREYRPIDELASELYLVAGAGETRAWWSDGTHTSEPDISIGVGEALRATGRHRVGMRVEARVEFGLGGDAANVACRGSCMTGASPPASLFALAGATW